MPVITWNEDVPSNTSYVRDFPAFMQSVTTNMAAALGTNVLYWTPTSGSAASVGEMQPGGTRTFFDAASNSSDADNATLGQRLFMASDTTRLYCYDSVGTYRVGTPDFVEIRAARNLFPSIAASAMSAQWLLQSGSVVYAAGGSTYSVVASFSTPYSSRPPTVSHAVGGSSIGVEYTVSLSTVTAGGVKFRVYPTPGYAPGTNPTIYWTSLGTVGGIA
jgi:hypothetical protein